MENKKKELLKITDMLSVIAKELDEQLEAKQPFKDKTLEELSVDWRNDDRYDKLIDYIKANPEAYIKAIQNLKK